MDAPDEHQSAARQPDDADAAMSTSPRLAPVPDVDDDAAALPPHVGPAPRAHSPSGTWHEHRMRPRLTNETPLGSRPLHTFADGLRQLLAAALIIPGAIWFLVSWGLKILVDVANGAHTQESRRPLLFRRPAAMPRERTRRSVADVAAELEKFPFNPTPQWRHISFMRYFGADGLGTLLMGHPELAGLPHSYPDEFRPTLLTGAQDVKLSGLVAMHPTTGPALIIAHGLMTHKNFDYIRRLALRARRWGFHVVVLDQRGWGNSAWTTDAQPAGGYMEGKDIVEIARWLKRDPRVTTVGAIGFSMGAGSCLNASHEASIAGDDALDGGVIALSAPSDIREAVEYVSKRPAFRSPYWFLYMIFTIALRRSLPRRGLPSTSANWAKLVRAASVPYYGVSEDEFYERASATTWAQEITTPTLEVHATDDFMVPVTHAYKLRDAAKGNENVHVMVVDQGNHVSFGAVDPRWFHSVVRRWFEYWAEEGGPAPR